MPCPGQQAMRFTYYTIPTYYLIHFYATTTASFKNLLTYSVIRKVKSGCGYCLITQWTCSEEIQRNSWHPGFKTERSLAVTHCPADTAEEAVPQRGRDFTSGPLYVNGELWALCLRCWQHLETLTSVTAAKAGHSAEEHTVRLWVSRDTR